MNAFSSDPVAHLGADPDKPHLLKDHLESVAKLASEFSQHIKGNQIAYLAGLWHDLGKYQSAFQRYIHDANEAIQNRHLEEDDSNNKVTKGKQRVDHSTPGALYARQQFAQRDEEQTGILLAYLIAGHHAGLPDYHSSGLGGCLHYRLGNAQNILNDTLREHPPAEILQPCVAEWSLLRNIPDEANGIALWIRMLFSCLVDADFLDTEEYFSPENAGRRGASTSLEAMWDAYQNHMKSFDVPSDPRSVNGLRQQILQRCLEQAKYPETLYTLTVPTGGGKTLASLGFALKHALEHGKDRIIYVIPYTSIIEQTTDIFRKVFEDLGNDIVLEHHSQINDESSTSLRLAAENWDVRLIVTTSVQFFESLFAAKPSRCRKLHNIANSVVIFDECQTLPVKLLIPILETLKLLTKYYGTTLVLSSATQPALHARDIKKGTRSIGRFHGFEDAIELMGDGFDKVLADQLERVKYHLPQRFDKAANYDDLVHDIIRDFRKVQQVLIVVGTRTDARELYLQLKQNNIEADTLFHLSALMCGQHRSDILGKIKPRLKNGLPVLLISTQLIEAGVDVSFPVVYRALAGLDSIIQAAGRCNRNNELAEKSMKGYVKVFIPQNEPFDTMLKHAYKTARDMFEAEVEYPFSLDSVLQYFEKYYAHEDQLFGKGNRKWEKHSILSEQTPAKGETAGIQFRTTAKNFQMIEQNQISVIVPYGKYNYEDLRKQLRNADTPTFRRTLRQLQRYTVGLYENEFKQMREQGLIHNVLDTTTCHNELWILWNSENYSEAFGVDKQALPCLVI